MIDNILSLLTAAGGVVVALGGWEFIKYFMNRKTNKRKAEAEADNSELETLRKQYDWLNEKYVALNERLDSLYKEFHALEDRNVALMRKNAELEVQLRIAEYNRCERPDDDCIRRLPKRYKCRIKDLLAGKYDEEEEDGKEKRQEETKESNHD